MRINSKRLRSRIEQINSESEDKTGGYTRLAFSEENKHALDLVKEMMKEAGLSIRRDMAGNLIGCHLGGCAPKGFVASGSHIDTVKNGGPFDGLLGAIAAIEAIQTIIEEGVPLIHPLQAIIFSDEEGARFGAGMIGSKSITGAWDGPALDEFVDEAGITLYDAMESFGAAPDRLYEAKAPDGTYKAFIELHIEQSVILDRGKTQIGIVSGIKGPCWIRGAFTGEANHAGGTPMELRHDALVAAANFTAEIERIASGIGDDFVATVGVMNVSPGGINTIPGKADYMVDVRDIDMERRSEGMRRIADAAERWAGRFGVHHDWRCIKNETSKMMSPCIMSASERACQKAGATHKTVTSGAFHDSLAMSSICDTGMIFVPSVGGISHSPQENTSWRDIYIGAEVLYRTIKDLATCAK